MVWPYLTPKVVTLPSGQGADDSNTAEKILEIKTAHSEGQPYIVLTDQSIHLYDEPSNAAIASHKRSKTSIDKYGANVSFKRNHDDNLLVIQTDKDYLLIYAILKPTNTNSDSELLTVYHQNSNNLLQNGLVAEKQAQFFQAAEVERPIWKFQLRFRLFLKISHGIVDFEPLNQFELLLITNHGVQLLDLSGDDNKTVDLKLGEDVKVTKIIHSPWNPDLFYFTLNNGKTTFMIKDKDTFTSIVDPEAFENVDLASINDSFKLVVGLIGDKLVYYNYEIKQIIKEKDFAEYGKVRKLQWSKSGNALCVLFEKGNWLLLSTFGGVTFNSKEHDYHSDWLENIQDLDITANATQLFLTNGEEIFSIQLIKSTYLENQINHSIRRPILMSGPLLHIYTGYEMNSSSLSKPTTWNTIKIPFEHYYQLPNITNVSISQDAKFLAVSNKRALLIYYFVDNEWSFYVNDFNADLEIGHITWFEGVNLLLLTNKSKFNSELVIFDFRRFSSKDNFNSDAIIFKYDFDTDIKLLNSYGKDIVVYTTNNKFYHFKIETVGASFKIDLIRILALDKIFKENDNFRSIIKVKSDDDENNDLLLLNNGEVIFLKYKDNNYFEKFLLLDKIEYIYKINDEEYYLYNGESVLLIKNLSELLKTRDPSKSILKISVEKYPILLILEKGLLIKMENSLVQKKTIEINNFTSKNSIFLHDLIRFELQTNDEATVFEKYSKYKNFQYSLELLLYQTIVNDQNLTKLSKLIKINPIFELNVVSKCLRKIEVKYWSRLFNQLKLTPQDLLDSSIEKKQFNILGNLIIIFLNYEKEDEDDIQDGNGENTNYYKITDETQIISIFKLIFENAKNDDELWETGFELIRFLKLLDPSLKLLQKGLDEVKKST